MKQIKCPGCGSILQTENENAPGYIKAHLSEKTGEKLCQRCFRLKHYNDIQDCKFEDNDFLKILHNIANENSLILCVVDLFDVTGSIIPGINRFIGNNDVILVGNKRDVLPKSLKDRKIKNWLRRIIKDYGYKITDIALISAQKGHGIDELLDMSEKYRHNRDVYIIGCTNVGKSTLVNALIKRFTKETADLITVSQFPGTTLGLIEIPLNETNSLYDTPGIINDHQYAFYLDYIHLKKVLPKKEIKPKVYQLDAGQTLFFAGLARTDYVAGPKTSFVCYFSNELYIHRTKTENADVMFDKHLGELFYPPTVAEYKKSGGYTVHKFKTVNEYSDIVISGLGFISLKTAGLQIAVHAPKNVGVYLRTSLF